MKRYHSFGKSVMTALFVTIFIGATLGCAEDSPEEELGLQGIVVTRSPTKILYTVGEPLNLSGIEVTGMYTGGRSKVETVTMSNISGYNANTVGQQTVTVTVGGKTAIFTVIVTTGATGGDATLQSIMVTHLPTKTVYTQGEALNLSGIEVTCIYTNGTTKTEAVTMSNISGYNPNTVGQQNVTVTVNGKTATFIVTVNNTSAPPIGLDDLASAAGGNTADNPVLVTVQSRLTKGGWATILSTIAAADKYVSLDLSACTITDAEFDPAASTTGAEKITALILPDTAESIKAGTSDNPTFKAFTALRSISGTSVETVGDYAFLGCTSLETVSLPVAMTIGDYAFYYSCTSLTEVSLPVAETIGEYAFYGCTSLTSVSLPVAMTIGTYAFSGCTGLTAVSLPVAETIGESVFGNCPNLTTITIAPANTAFTAHDGMLLNKAETTLIAYPSASGDISLSSVTVIGAYAFYYCDSLESVSLPAATTIGAYAFYYCDSLESVSLPAATTIGAYAFRGCTSLTSVSLPVATTIGGDGSYTPGAFQGCTSLTEVSLPAVTSIGGEAFRGCTSLAVVNLPASLTTVPSTAFAYCSALTTITVDPANTAFAAHDGMLLNKAETTLIAYSSASGDITLSSITVIGAYAFSGASLTSVSLPAVTTIGEDAFSSCMSLETVSLPATPPSIPTWYYGYGIFSYTGSDGTITVRVPTGAVSAYTSAWGVDANTAAEGNTSVYGYQHKAVTITDAAQ